MALNQRRISQALQANHLDALIATTPENVAYVSGHDSPLPRFFHGLQEYALLTPAGESGLVIPANDIAYLAASPFETENIWCYGEFFIEGPFGTVPAGPEETLRLLMERSRPALNAATALADALKALQLTAGRIGVDEGNFSPDVRQAILEAFPSLVIEEAAALFKQIRMIKTEAEIERLRQAAEVNQRAFLALRDHIRAGITEGQLMQIYREALVKQGAIPGLNSGGAGTRSGAPFMPPATYPLTTGDLFRFDGTAVYDGYWTDFGRTLAVSQASDKAQRYYAALLSGFQAGLQLVRPGQSVAELFDTVMRTVRAEGIAHYRRHHVGHGIGIEVYDPPILGPATKANIFKEGGEGLALEENMVICLEVPYYELGFGGLQVEDTLVVREGGYEPLITLEHDLMLCS